MDICLSMNKTATIGSSAIVSGLGAAGEACNTDLSGLEVLVVLVPHAGA